VPLFDLDTVTSTLHLNPIYFIYIVVDTRRK
jgi:hypothetical protein